MKPICFRTQPINNPFLSKQRGLEWLRVEQRRIAMAANCTRRSLQVSLASARTLLSRTASASSPFASKASKLNGGFSVQKRMFSRLRFYHLRYPVDCSFESKWKNKKFTLFGCWENWGKSKGMRILLSCVLISFLYLEDWRRNLAKFNLVGISVSVWFILLRSLSNQTGHYGTLPPPPPPKFPAFDTCYLLCVVHYSILFMGLNFVSIN